MRRFRLFATLLVCGLLLVCGSVRAADYPATTIRFGDVINRNFGYYQGMLAFKQEIEKRTSGKITVELLSDGVLGSPKDTLEAVQLGAVQLAMNAASYTQNVVPEHRFWDMPFLFPSRQAWRAFAYGPLGKENGAKIEAHGLKFLTWCSAGGRGIVSKKPLASPADFAGQKIREQPNTVLIDTLKAFGAQPVVMNLGDVYTSLDQGVIDGADVTVELVTSYKFHESAKYYTEVQHIMTPGMVVANLAWWKGLDANTQKLIEDVIATRFLDVNDTWFIAADPSAPLPEQQKALKVLVDRGVTIVKADLPALRKAAEPVFAKYKAALGADFVERVQRSIGK